MHKDDNLIRINIKHVYMRKNMAQTEHDGVWSS